MAATSQPKPLEEVSILLALKAPHFRERKFASLVAHIEKLFTYYLCSSGNYVLDGKGMVHLFLGQHAALPGYVSVEPNQWSSIDSPDFDLDEFFALDAVDQDEFVLKTVENALLVIAKKTKADQKPILAAAKAIRESGYDGFIPWPGEMTPHPRLALTAQTCHRFSHGIAFQVCVQLRDINGTVLETASVPNDIANKNPFFNGFKMSRWSGTVFHFCNEKRTSLYSVDFRAFADAAEKRKENQDTVSQTPKTTSRETVASKRQVGSPKKVDSLPEDELDFDEIFEAVEIDLGRDTTAAKRPKADEKYQVVGQQFLEHVVKGDAATAYRMLSKFRRKHLKKAEFIEKVSDFFRFADPDFNFGVTFEQVQSKLYINVEDEEIMREYAKSLPEDTPQDSIVAALEAGCEAISREPLTLFVVSEGKSLKLDLL